MVMAYTDQMRLVTSDEPVQEARMAAGKLAHDRAILMGKWLADGHLEVLGNGDDPKNVRLQMEDEVFVELRSEFPSENLITRVQLALAAGRTHLAVPRVLDDYKFKQRGYDMATDLTMEAAYQNVAKITATVKKLRNG